MSLIHSPLVPKIQTSYFPPSLFKPAFCRLCFSFWFVTAVGHLQWADGMDICGEGGKKWALCSRTLEIWFWSITRQRVTEEVGGSRRPLNFLQQALSYKCKTFCTPSSQVNRCRSLWRVMTPWKEERQSYLGTCNLLLPPLVDLVWIGSGWLWR